MAKDNTKELAKFDNGVSSTIVTGTGGSPRHGGYFSKQNPYLDDMSMGRTNQDIDASYERAVEWEADYANLQEQRAYDRAVLEEQREYDSPLARLQRDKAAGINSELAAGAGSAGSSGGSSAQLAQREIDDQQAQTKFSNSYDNLDKVFAGINAGASLIGSLSGGFSSIVSGISQLKTLPSQIALNEANAGLATANANEVTSLLDGKKRSLNLDNISKHMGLVSNLQGLLKNGFTDDEGTNLLNTLGVPADEQGQLMQSIRGVHQNPALLSKFHEDNLSARRAKWNDKVFDDTTVESFTQLAKQIEFDQLQFKYADAYLQQSVMNALMYDEDYQSDLVDTALNMASTNKVNSDVLYQNALKDCDAWGKLWDEKKAVCDGLLKEVNKLKAKAEEDGEWTDEEVGNYTVAWSKYQACRGSLSNEFNQMRGFFIDAMQKRYERGRMMTNGGAMRGMDLIGAINYFSRINFDSSYDTLPSGGQIAREWTNTAIGAVGAAGSLALGVGVLTKPPVPLQAGHTVTNYTYGSDGKQQKVSKTKTQYNYLGE